MATRKRSAKQTSRDAVPTAQRDRRLSALTSPVRLEIVSTMESSGTCSIAELAQAMNRPADSLYYHVRKLVEVGVLAQRGSRKQGRRDEALYGLVHKNLKFKHGTETEASRHAAVKAAGSLMRLAERDFEHAVDQGAAVRGSRARVYAGRVKLRLSATGVQHAHRLLNELRDLLHEDRVDEEDWLFALTVCLAPVDN